MPHHAGVYIIVAKNESGEARSGASLNLTTANTNYKNINYDNEANFHEINSLNTDNKPQHLLQVIFIN